MGKLTILLVLAFVAIIVAGAVYLAVWTPPAPSAPVEKVLPDARFPK
jgi:hypothetical protein